MGGLVAAQAPAGPLVFGPQAAWFRPADAEGIARAVAPYGGRPWCSNAARDVDGCG